MSDKNGWFDASLAKKLMQLHYNFTIKVYALSNLEETPSGHCDYV
jgi:hypothetical protein